MKEYRIILIQHAKKGEVLIVERKLWFLWVRAHHWKKYFYSERDAVAFIQDHAQGHGYVIHYCY